MNDTLPVAILAGGLATRLRPLSESLPKALAPVAGEPFAAHQLRLLASAGIARVVYCLGRFGELVEQFVGDGRRFGLSVEYSHDGPTPLGTAGAIRRALPLLQDAFFTLYGDSYLPCEYRAAQNAFLRSGRKGLMTVFRNDGRWDTSNVAMGRGRILRYDKKHREPRMRHIDYGLGAFRAEAFAGISTDRATDLSEVYQRLLDEGELAVFEVSERFYEIGSFRGLAELGEFLEARMLERKQCGFHRTLPGGIARDHRPD